MNIESDIWQLAEGTWNDGLPIIVRVREEIEQIVGHPDYSDGYRITWTFQNSDERGFPTKEENDELEKFENIVFDALERGHQAIGVAVVTHNKERDWTFYTSDPEQTHQSLIDALSGHPPFPIKLMSAPDPNWEEYKGILTNIGKKL